MMKIVVAKDTLFVLVASGEVIVQINALQYVIIVTSQVTRGQIVQKYQHHHRDQDRIEILPGEKAPVIVVVREGMRDATVRNWPLGLERGIPHHVGT